MLATPALAQQKPTPEQYIGNFQVVTQDALAEIKAAMVQRDQQIATLNQVVKADAVAMEADKKTIADLTAKGAGGVGKEPEPAK